MILIEDTRQKTGKHDTKHQAFADGGVQIIRCKLPFGDYAPVPPVSVDTKENIDEIAANICGKEHTRFIAECKAAKAAGCKLIILVENRCGITHVSEVHKWINPRAIYSPKAVQGDRLQKAMETITERYGTEFMFCTPEEAGNEIIRILSEWEIV